MGYLKVADRNSYNKVLEPLRFLKVWDNEEKKYIEKYRLYCRNSQDGLIYGKGKINLNFSVNNIYEDSNKEKHKILKLDYWGWDFPTSLYAYHKDGFYELRNSNNKWYKYTDSLKDLVTEIIDSRYFDDHNLSEKITFDGWYLSKNKAKGEQPINSIEQVYSYTSLFKYNNGKNKNSLPEITLYAHWKIPTYNITVNNITKTYTDKNRKEHTGYSSFTIINEKKKKENKNGKAKNIENRSYTFKNVILGTDVQKYLSKNVINLKYHSWGSHALDGTKNQDKLRSNPQKFAGWSNELHATNLSVWKGDPWSLKLKESLRLYCQFNSIIIFKYRSFSKKTLYSSLLNAIHRSRPNDYVSSVGGIYQLYCNDYDDPNFYRMRCRWPVFANINAINADRFYPDPVIICPYDRTSRAEGQYYQTSNKYYYNEQDGYDERDPIAYYWMIQKKDNSLKVPKSSEIPLYGGNKYFSLPFSSTIICSLKAVLRYSEAYKWWTEYQ